MVLDREFSFGGVERLWGSGSLALLEQAHFVFVGIGGVGSWAVETAVRSGVGKITIMDYDSICVSNINRQIQATSKTVGQQKTKALESRALEINPQLKITVLDFPFEEKVVEDFFSRDFDGIIDGIDDSEIKSLLIAEAIKRNVAILTTGGAGGKCDLTSLEVKDLFQTHGDHLLYQVRKKLRKFHGVPAAKTLGVNCVFSSEASILSQQEEGQPRQLDCRSGYGTSVAMTATMGMWAAHLLINQFLFSKQKNK